MAHRTPYRAARTRIPIRQIQLDPPADDAEAVRRAQLNDHALATSGVHGVGTAQVESTQGAQAKVDVHAALTSAHGATAAATGDRIILRDSAGRAKVAAPSASDDIAQKAQVDTVQANLDAKMHATTGHKHTGGNGDAPVLVQPVAVAFLIDGGGSAITTGSKGYLEIPFACTITGWTIVSDQTGSIVVDVRRATYANFPTVGSIAGTEKPTLSSARKNQDLSLTTWTTAIAAGDILEFVVESAATVQRVTIGIRATRP